MKENTKTLTFIVAAVLVVLVAVIVRPRPPRPAEEAEVRGKDLFKDFQPLEAASLEIFDFDEEQATVRPFKVAQTPGKDGTTRWSIPSHDDYPADAQDQLADAAASMMGLTILDKVSDSPGEHATYGVLEPDPNRLKAGATGVGTKVMLRDKEGKELVAIIIGKEAPDGNNLRYVRRVGEDPVYIVEVKTDKLSTKFEDWIEEDLLKLSTWDIREVRVLDYSFDEMTGQPNIRGQFALKYNDAGEPKWELIEDRVIKEQKWADRNLGEDQELDTAKLDAMRNAFDDLEIVDVSPKPEGLSAELRDTGTFRTNQEAVLSLANRGFYLVPVSNQQYELLSSEGEVRVVTKDGVQYTLRFGNVAAGTGGGRVVGEKAKEEAEDGDLNRFLFVMAEFNPEMIEKPELEPMPGEEPKKAEGEEKTDAEPAAENEKAEDPAAETEKTEDESADAAEAKEETGADADARKDDQAERDRIERDNKRKLDEYEKKVEEGKKKVKELNDRFADWYYVISDDVYKKIHLNRDEIIKKKETKDENQANDAAGGAAADPVQSFQNLKEAGPAGDNP